MANLEEKQFVLDDGDQEALLGVEAQAKEAIQAEPSSPARPHRPPVIIQRKRLSAGAAVLGLLLLFGVWLHLGMGTSSLQCTSQPLPNKPCLYRLRPASPDMATSFASMSF